MEVPGLLFSFHSSEWVLGFILNFLLVGIEWSKRAGTNNLKSYFVQCLVFNGIYRMICAG